MHSFSHILISYLISTDLSQCSTKEYRNKVKVVPHCNFFFFTISKPGHHHRQEGPLGQKVHFFNAHVDSVCFPLAGIPPNSLFNFD